MKIEFNCSDNQIERAFKLALSTVASNIKPTKCGILESPQHVLLPGSLYPTQWTRDAAINVWNAANCLDPEVSKNTLLSVLAYEEGGVVISGQYWDNIIWSIAAWRYHKLSGDQKFLDLLTSATVNTLTSHEKSEFDPEVGLFKGPACYADGVSAYPDEFTCSNPTGERYLSSSILDVALNRPETSDGTGRLNVFSLSTNCLYLEAYKILASLGVKTAVDPDGLAAAIKGHFRCLKSGRFYYLLRKGQGFETTETLGVSFAVLFDLLSESEAKVILESVHREPAGVPCLWPPFKRYLSGDNFGRHSGTVWPPIQGFFALAALKAGMEDVFSGELRSAARNALSAGGFYEIFHPQSGVPYGGVQEFGADKPKVDWISGENQTWSATAFIAMVIYGLMAKDPNINSRPLTTFAPSSISGLVY